MGLIKRAQRVASSGPVWRLRGGQHVASWHDARAQGLAAGVDRGSWHVPLIVDGRPTALTGELRRFPAPSIVLWLILLAAVTAVGGAVGAVGRGAALHRGAVGLAIVAAAASITVDLVFALDSYASPGTWIAAADEIVLIAAGLGVVLKGPANLRAAGVIGVGLMASAIGLIHGPVFLHPIVLAALPSTVTRALTLIGLAAGIDAAVVGCLAYLREHPSRPEREWV